jgi:D-glycero-beta-D-manno-heptose-7-phosphate kinase
MQISAEGLPEMTKENESKDLPAPKKTESVEPTAAKDSDKPDVTVKDMRDFTKQNKLDLKSSQTDPNIGRLDLSLGDPKTGRPLGPGVLGGRSLGKIESSLGLPQAKDPTAGILKEGQPTFTNKEFLLPPGTRPSDQFRNNDFFGRPFQQMLKSEFKDESNPATQELKTTVDNFLTDTAPEEHKGLTPGERLTLIQTRRAMEESHNLDELFSNALHLARLYQHLRYIDDAKKAASLALYIDPDNTAGKQLFEELERVHPADLGSLSFAVPAGVHLLSKAKLRERVKAFSKGRIMVIGDLLIDELLEGKPERISREAPVLILEHVLPELIPGGAANTAHNIAALNAVCHAVGICGKDEYAQKLAHLLEDCYISHSLVPDESRPTTVKTRILSKTHSQMQQLLRLDRISHEKVSEAVSQALVHKIKLEAVKYQAIILSDYRAGVVTDGVIEACRELAKERNVMVVVDAQEGFERFRDLTLMTPNQPDTEKAVGFAIETKDDLRKAGSTIMHATGLEALLVTRGGQGMALFQKDKEMVELPAFNRSAVFDVTGAGDTVVATMTLALVTGASYVEAMALGNLAAGIVVRKSGTAVTNQRELLENLERLDLPE